MEQSPRFLLWNKLFILHPSEGIPEPGQMRRRSSRAVSATPDFRVQSPGTPHRKRRLSLFSQAPLRVWNVLTSVASRSCTLAESHGDFEDDARIVAAMAQWTSDQSDGFFEQIEEGMDSSEFTPYAVEHLERVLEGARVQCEALKCQASLLTMVAQVCPNDECAVVFAHIGGGGAFLLEGGTATRLTEMYTPQNATEAERIRRKTMGMVRPADPKGKTGPPEVFKVSWPPKAPSERSVLRHYDTDDEYPCTRALGGKRLEELGILSDAQVKGFLLPTTAVLLLVTPAALRRIPSLPDDAAALLSTPGSSPKGVIEALCDASELPGGVCLLAAFQCI
jgi:hypothetical protein